VPARRLRRPRGGGGTNGATISCDECPCATTGAYPSRSLRTWSSMHPPTAIACAATSGRGPKSASTSPMSGRVRSASHSWAGPVIGPRGEIAILPCSDGGVPSIPEETERVLDYALKAAQPGRFVELGCHAGHGRTGTALAAVMIMSAALWKLRSRMSGTATASSPLRKAPRFHRTCVRHRLKHTVLDVPSPTRPITSLSVLTRYRESGDA
jgi:hypothetical protein